jgi:nucleoside-diphosphate-sugar epimerase
MICVTGSTSHTGVRVIRRLLDEFTDEIRCIVRLEERARKRLPGDERMKIIEGDINDDSAMRDVIAGARAVINVAHIRFGPRLAKLCATAGVERLVCVSSTRRFTKFADSIADVVIDSEEKLKQSRINWTILRSSMIYGGADDNNIQKLVDLVRRRRILILPGGGRNLVQPIFVGDLIGAIIGSIENEKTFQRDFTLAGPKAITYRQMIGEIADALGRKVAIVPAPIGFGVAVVGALSAIGVKLPVKADQIRRLGEDKAFDISEAKSELGFAPRPFREGLQEKLNGTA